MSGESNEFSLTYSEFEVLLDNQIETPARDGHNNNNDYCIHSTYKVPDHLLLKSTS